MTDVLYTNCVLISGLERVPKCLFTLCMLHLSDYDQSCVGVQGN